MTANPYGGTTWRRFEGHSASTLTRGYMEGSSRVARPRDEQHAWFYHIEHAYLMSGNKWIKDWYDFMGEFKKVHLQRLDPWPEYSTRAVGHSLAVALSAYSATDNTSLGEILSNYTQVTHSKYLVGDYHLANGGNWGDDPRGAPFQYGYLMKPFINIYNEFPEDNDQENSVEVKTRPIDFIKRHVEWNYDLAHYGYYRNLLSNVPTTQASGSSLSFVDVAIWYAMHSGETKFADHAITYVTQGIGGKKPYGKWTAWTGQYESQVYHYYLQQLNNE